MIDPRLQSRLWPVARRQRRLRLSCELAGCWAVASVLGLAWSAFAPPGGSASTIGWGGVGVLGVASALFVVWRGARTAPAWRELARRIESCHPDLDGRLITAVQQQLGPGGAFNYLQARLVQEALRHSEESDWTGTFPRSHVALAHAAHGLALALFVVTLLGLRTTDGRSLLAKALNLGSGITVTPGDVHLERGDSLVVLARFGGAVPARVELAVAGSSGTVQRIPMIKSLADPLFGSSVPEVAGNFLYHLEYGGQRTRDFHVTVFEHPRLERADADLVFPDYTGQPAKRIEDTRRLSAVEGSRLDLILTLNKPVTSARLVARNAETHSLALGLETNGAVAALRQFQLEASRTYELRLVDAEGRTNKVPSLFVFEVSKNRVPELRLASPRGDLRPTPLEEIAFEGTVWDDFGVAGYGLGYARAGQEPVWIELGRGVPGKEKRPFQHVLRLEDLGVQPDQLLSWFAWAEDLGPDGQIRRTPGDLFFAEVRPFDEIFREGQGREGQSQQGQSGDSSEQEGNPTSRLAELQKQIIAATWRLQREQGVARPPARGTGTNASERLDPPAGQGAAVSRNPGSGLRPAWNPSLQALGGPGRMGFFAAVSPAPATAPARDATAERAPAKEAAPERKVVSSPEPRASYEEDVAVVRDSQAQALEQAEAAAQSQQDPRTARLWAAALEAMEKALARLHNATRSPASLAEALAEEQKVYQALLRLQEHEYQVARTRRQNRNPAGRGRDQQSQRQLEEMDLAQADNRYETLRQAQAPPTAQRREQLQVMNRLQELARRQQDLNERLKELQTALQEARDEPQRAEIERRLKRLEEEERQMLADLDEVRQRLDRPENQSQMAEERRQLDQARDDLQRAADAAGQGATSQALASGTRAQRQLQQLRDQLRQENSSQFAEDLREMRAEARDLARQQEDIARKMDAEAGRERRTLSASPERQEVLDQLARQKERLTNLVDRATQVSQQAESSEPLLSRQLQDTLRKFSQDSTQAMRDTQDQLLTRGLVTRSLYDRLKDKSQPEGARLLELTSEMLRQDFLPQAAEAGQRARAGIDDLKRGVERAAESVLGDDTQALRLARQELDQLADQLEREMNRTEGVATNPPGQIAQTETGRGADRQPPGNDPGAQTRNSERDPGQTARTGQDGRTPGDPGQRAGADRGGRLGAASGGGGEGGDLSGSLGREWDRLLNDGAAPSSGPITGRDFVPWSDRLRDVEEMIEEPGLRNEVAAARERARFLRQEYKRDLKKPDWAVVRLQVMKPLVEVRDRIAEELSRRESREALVPIDRDPVPNRYSDLVRRYYEELGKEK